MTMGMPSGLAQFRTANHRRGGGEEAWIRRIPGVIAQVDADESMIILLWIPRPAGEFLPRRPYSLDELIRREEM